MRALDEIIANQITNGILHLDLMCEINPRWRPDFQSVTNFQITRAAKLVPNFSNQDNDVAFAFKPLRGDVWFGINQSDHPDGWRWIHHGYGALVIQRHISARNRRTECPACFRYSFNCFT